MVPNLGLKDQQGRRISSRQDHAGSNRAGVMGIMSQIYSYTTLCLFSAEPMARCNPLVSESGVLGDKLKSPTGAKHSSTGPLLSNVVDVEYIPLAVDLCHWVAEQTASCLEVEQFVQVSYILVNSCKCYSQTSL